MVKRPQGSTGLVSPCWRPGIRPVFKDQSCNFLFSTVLCDWVSWIKQKPYSELFLYMLILLCFISLSSNEHMSSCPCSIPPPLFCNIALFFFCASASLLIPSFPLFPSFPHFPFSLHLLLLCSVYLPPSFPLPPSLPSFPLPTAFPPLSPSALHSFVWSPSSYSQHIRCPTNESRESGRAKGRAWCRAQGTRFNEASLNEFTAFHWAAPSHVAD